MTEQQKAQAVFDKYCKYQGYGNWFVDEDKFVKHIKKLHRKINSLSHELEDIKKFI